MTISPPIVNDVLPADAQLRSLENIINRSRAMVFLWRVADGWPVDYVTDNVSQLGYSADDFISGRVSWPGITHPEDNKRLEAEVKKYLDDGVMAFSQRYRLFDARGKIHWVEDETSAVTNASGEITHFQGIVIDVSDRLAVENALATSENTCRAVVENAGEAICTVDREGTYLFANSTACLRLGLEPGALEGKRMHDLFPAEVADRQLASVRDVLDSGTAALKQTWTVVSGEKRWYNTSLAPIRDKDGMCESVLVIARDATDIREQHEALRQSEERYRRLLDCAPDAIITCQPDGTIVDANPGVWRVLGVGQQDVLGRRVQDFMSAEELAARPLRIDDVLNGEVVKATRRLHRTGNGEIVVESVTSLLPDGNLLAVVRDVTERVEAEEELRQARDLLEARVHARTEELVESRRTLELLVANQRDAVFRFDLDKGFTFISPAIERITGYFAEAYRNDPDLILRISHPDDMPVLKAVFDDVRGGKEPPASVSIRLFHCSGRQVFVEYTLSAGRDEDGAIAAIEGICRDVTQRALDEQDIRDANEYLETVIKTSHDGILVVDENGIFEYANQSALDTMGWPAEDFVGEPFIKVVPPDYHEFILQRWEEVQAGRGQPYQTDIVTKEGERRSLQVSHRHMTIGGERKYCVVFRDNTEKKRADEELRHHRDHLEEMVAERTAALESVNAKLESEASERLLAEAALRESEANFRALADNAADAIVIESSDGVVVYANRHAAELTGYSLQELEHMSVNDLVVPGDRARLMRSTRHRLSGGTVPSPYALNLLSKDGTQIPVEVSGGLTVWRGHAATIGLMRDIRTRLQATRALRESEQRLARAQRVAHVGSWEWVEQTGEIVWSDELCRIMGEDAATYVPTYEGIIEIIHPEDRQRAETTLRNAYVRQRRCSLEFRLYRKDGECRHVLCQADVVRNSSDESLRLVGTVLDITDRKATEQALARSHAELRLLAGHLQRVRDAERTQIAREIHDELGQMLTAMKLDIHWLAGKVEEQPAIQDRAQTMLSIADSMIQTVQRLAQELKPALLDDEGLRAAIEWHLEQFGHRTGIDCTCTMRLDEDPGRELSTAVFRVFQEALTNVARHASASHVTVSLRKTRKAIDLKIRDDGVGIEDARLTDPLCMGLIGMRERVVTWNGTIQVRGRAGRGTVVQASFPLENRGID